MKRNPLGWKLNFTSNIPVKVLVYKLNDFSFKDIWQKALVPQEIHRMNKFNFQIDADRFAARRYLAKFLIADLFNSDLSDINFKYSKFGKPYLQDRHLFFNWSFSNDLLAIVISTHFPAGIDIEFINPDFVFLPLWEKVVTNQDIAPDRLTFFKYWTAHEAIIKLFGKSLSNMSFSRNFEFLSNGNVIIDDLPGIMITQRMIPNYIITTAVIPD